MCSARAPSTNTRGRVRSPVVSRNVVDPFCLRLTQPPLRNRNVDLIEAVSICFALGTIDNIRAMCAPRYFCSAGLIVLAGLLCFFPLDGCGNRRGFSKLRPCRLPGIDEKVLCGKLTVF